LLVCGFSAPSAENPHTDIELTQLSHSTSQSRVFACGSMVRSDHMFVVFALYERKNEKKDSTA
jgi:hypothetical protein